MASSGKLWTPIVPGASYCIRSYNDLRKDVTEGKVFVYLDKRPGTLTSVLERVAGVGCTFGAATRTRIDVLVIDRSKLFVARVCAWFGSTGRVEITPLLSLPPSPSPYSLVFEVPELHIKARERLSFPSGEKSPSAKFCAKKNTRFPPPPSCLLR